MTSEITKKRALIAIVLIAIVGVIYCIKRNKPPEIPLPIVVVQKPQWSGVVDYVTQTGTLVSYNSVDLVARVAGYLDAIEFTDGSFVKKGQELFVIQPQPYLEKLKGAQANVLVQKANYAYAKAEYARQQVMYKQHATSLNNVEKWLAKMEAADGEIAEAEANQVIAAINYSYTHVLAPFDGRIGRHLVDTNNLVGNGAATELANIQQLDPIYAYFNLSELDLIKIRTAAKAAGFKPSNITQVPVYVKLQNETTFTHKGSLDFANTALNASTGTMEFRALLNNKDFALLPGLFVQVRIPVSTAKKELMVPAASVLYDQIGAYVLIVDKNDLVQLKRIELGTADQGNQPVTKGLTADDRVIVNGLQFATPGNAVDVHDQA
jgi:RND family efflux transporter MFP subunit